MTPPTLTPQQLREVIRDILFRAAGGVTDMADREVREVMVAFSDALGAIELPEKRPGYLNDNSSLDNLAKIRGRHDQDEGYNEAIDQCQATIHEFVKELTK